MKRFRNACRSLFGMIRIDNHYFQRVTIFRVCRFTVILNFVCYVVECIVKELKGYVEGLFGA